MKYILFTIVLTLAFLVDSKAQCDTLVIYLNNDQIEKIPLSQIHSFNFENVSSVEEQTKPSNGFTVRGNYPNPFNPSTSIRYTISGRQFVKLKVFDLNGKELATLVDEYQSTGSYSVDFNAGRFQPGVYVYQLQTNGGIETKKMILMK